MLTDTMKKYFLFAWILLLICLFSTKLSAQTFGEQRAKFKIETQVVSFQIGAEKLDVIISKTAKRQSKFVYFNLHDNENTAVEAAKEIIRKYGGTLIELKNSERRMVNFTFQEKQYTFDPNRIFTRVGIEKTLKENGEFSIAAAEKVDEFAAALKLLLKKFRLIIAVHNNTNENYSLKSYEDIEKLGKDVRFFVENPNFDIDDFFYVTESRIFQYLKQKNQNVVLQDNRKVTDDGSLSVYCGQNKIPYINVESQHGHLLEQTKMLEILQSPAAKYARGIWKAETR